MSTINGRRQVGHGVGGANASIDDRAFSPGVWGGWVSDDEAFFANGADGWVASLFDQRSGLIRRAVADPANPQFGAGLNHGFAGGGVWAGWLGSGEDDPQRGLFASSGVHLPAAYLLGVGPAGELAFKPQYQSLGPSMVLELAGQVALVAAAAAAGGCEAALAALGPQLQAAGLYWLLAPGSAFHVQLLGGGRAIWEEGQRLQVAGLPQPRQLGAAWLPAAHLIDGRWWVSYYSSLGGIILHPFDRFDGVTVVPPGIDAWHSARSFGSKVEFALFSTPAEQNGYLRRVTVDLATAPLAPLEPPPPPLVLPPPARPLWAGWFEFAPEPHGPGNAVLAVRNIAGALTRSTLVTDETAHLVSGPRLGRFLSGASVEEIEAKAAACEDRPVVYWDDRWWPRWPKLPAGAWLCVRLYWEVDESLDSFISESRVAIFSAPRGLPVVIVGQQYSSNASQAGYVDPSAPAPQPSEALRELAVALTQLANECQNVVGLMLFSGYGRRGGLMDHPDLVEPWSVWAAQLQPPAFEPYPPTPPKPPSLYPAHKEHRMSAKQIVAIVGPAGKYGRPAAKNTGPWGDLKDAAGKPRGWRGLLWDGDTPSDEYRFELSQPDAKHQLYHPGVAGFFGADATAHATKPGSDQFYIKPEAEGRGGYEAPVIYEGNLTPGLLAGWVEFVDERGKKFVSCGFAIEVLS